MLPDLITALDQVRDGGSGRAPELCRQDGEVG